MARCSTRITELAGQSLCELAVAGEADAIVVLRELNAYVKHEKHGWWHEWGNEWFVEWSCQWFHEWSNQWSLDVRVMDLTETSCSR